MESGITTIQVSKATSEKIQNYCIRVGLRKADFVNRLWQWFEPFQREIDLTDIEQAIYLPSKPGTNKNQGDSNNKAILQALQTIVEGINPQRLIDVGREQEKAGLTIQHLTEENARLTKELEELKALNTETMGFCKHLRNDIKQLRTYRAAARAEFARIREHQPYIGKIDIYEIPE